MLLLESQATIAFLTDLWLFSTMTKTLCEDNSSFVLVSEGYAPSALNKRRFELQKYKALFSIRRV